MWRNFTRAVESLKFCILMGSFRPNHIKFLLKDREELSLMTPKSDEKLKSKIFSLNPHMHKLGPRGPTHYIFGDWFYSKNARKLRFHVFLYFYARKHMISSFYPKWTEFTRNCAFHSKYGSRRNQTKLEQNSQFLGNSVHFR